MIAGPRSISLLGAIQKLIQWMFPTTAIFRRSLTDIVTRYSRHTVLGKTSLVQEQIDVGEIKDLTGVSRKFAIPLLEYLDRQRVTRRVGGDEREQDN
jgi:hypothetical protein